MSGNYARLNGEMITSSNMTNEGGLISVVGRMEAVATDSNNGVTLTFRASDDKILHYEIQNPDFDFVQVRHSMFWFTFARDCTILIHIYFI